METLWTIIIGWILNAIESMVHMHAEASEYCQFEFFNASCSPGQVVFMDEARYGRLQLGRCVTRDYGFLGCSANVLDILDRHCSGRRWCEFGVPGLRDLVQPCPKDLTSYLEASYHCIPVVDLMSTRCNSTVALSNLSSIGASSSSSSSSGGIYSLATAITSSRHRPPAAIAFISSLHGWDHDMTLTSFSASCPLFVSAHPGQAINFTLYSFGYYLDRSIDAGSSSSGGRNSGGGGDAPRGLLFCPAHAFITDAQRSQGYALCPWRQRERNLFVSRNHLVALHFTQQYRKMPNARKGTFILKMEAVGCPDVQSPDSGAWVERYEDRMIIRCNHSQQTWHLTCKHTRWIGTVENCTEVAPMSSRERISLEKIKVEIGLVVAVVIGVVLGVVFGLSLLIGLLFYVHRRRQFGKKTKRLLDELDSKEEGHRRGVIQRPYYGCQEYSGREGVCLSRSCRSDPRAGLGGHGGSGRGRQHSCTAEYTQMIELRYRAPSIFEALTPVNELPEVQPETPPTLSPTSGVQPETEKVSGAEGGSDFTTIGRLRTGMTGAVTRCRYVPLPIINPTLPNDKDLKLNLDTPILSHPDLIGLNISADNSRQVAQYEPENNPLECTTKQ